MGIKKRVFKVISLPAATLKYILIVILYLSESQHLKSHNTKCLMLLHQSASGSVIMMLLWFGAAVSHVLMIIYVWPHYATEMSHFSPKRNVAGHVCVLV